MVTLRPSDSPQNVPVPASARTPARVAPAASPSVGGAQPNSEGQPVQTAPRQAAAALNDVRQHARLEFSNCVDFAQQASQAGPAEAVPAYTKAQQTPPNGRTLPTDLRKFDEKKLLGETNGQGALWAVGDWKPGARPLILVHGIGSDFGDIQPLIDKYKSDPTRQVMVYAYSDLGEFTEESGVQLAHQMTAMRRDYPWADSLDIVAHSMGGIVSRRALNELADGQLGGIEKFKDIHFTAVDTPWHGFPGPGIRLNFVQGGMDMQASSEMFTGTDDMPDGASRKGLTGVKLPKQVEVSLVFADNEAAGLKRDGIKDYTDFTQKLSQDKLQTFVRAMTRGSREEMQKQMPQQAFNFFSALQADRSWPQLRQELMDVLDSGHLDTHSFNLLLQRRMPRFTGEHSGVLGDPGLLEAVNQRLGKSGKS